MFTKNNFENSHLLKSKTVILKMVELNLFGKIVLGKNCSVWEFNPIALKTAKTLWSFDHSECNRVKDIH